MIDPISGAITALADINSMGDKVAAFAIAQNFLWTAAALKGDLKRWPSIHPRWFVGGAVLAGLTYVAVEACLWWHARDLVCASYCTQGNQKMAASATNVLFFMRGLGAVASSIIAGLAFRGTATKGLEGVD